MGTKFSVEVKIVHSNLVEVNIIKGVLVAKQFRFGRQEVVDFLYEFHEWSTAWPISKKVANKMLRTISDQVMAMLLTPRELAQLRDLVCEFHKIVGHYYKGNVSGDKPTFH